VGYVKAVGTTNRHENWTAGIVLERDEETGEVTKQVTMGVPVELSKDDQKKLEKTFGFIFEDSSKQEADDAVVAADAQPVGADVAAAAPLLGASSGTADQTAAARSSRSSGSSNE
jgi:hypothetical protein